MCPQIGITNEFPTAAQPCSEKSVEKKGVGQATIARGLCSLAATASGVPSSYRCLESFAGLLLSFVAGWWCLISPHTYM